MSIFSLSSRSSGFLVVGYHGCDAVVRDDLVTGRIECLNQSENDYDWLGPGFYLFENDPLRAQMLAQASHDHPDLMYTKKAITTPAVVGVVLRIQRWLDMTTQDGLKRFDHSHEILIEYLGKMSVKPPRNESAGDHDSDYILRKLDNAVFHALHQEWDVQFGGGKYYQAVRGAFPQGDYITEHSFRTDSHVQLAVRDDSCVVGWFLPEGAQLMSSADYELAKDAWNRANTKRKPKKRVSS